MSVNSIDSYRSQSVSQDKTKRRFLSPEKKYQIFLEAQRGDTQAGQILRREGLYSTDLARIRLKVKEGAIERTGYLIKNILHHHMR